MIKEFEAILFDLGNTLIAEDYSGLPIEKQKVKVLPGADELISKLDGKVKLGIVSNTTSISAEQIRVKLAEVELADKFEVIIATAELGVHKPDPAPIKLALEKLGANPEKSLFVGDRMTDQIAARAAGMDFIFTGTNIDAQFWLNLENRESALQRAMNSKFEYSTSFELAAQEKFDSLVKPPGSLGRLEPLVAKIAGICHSNSPAVDPAAIALFIGDHGIAKDDSVTPWPQSITREMGDLAASGEAAISTMTRANEIFLEIINVGTVEPSTHKDVYDHRIAAGTKDIRFENAMTLGEVRHAMEVGAQTAERLIAGGSRCLGVGEVGIGNTTIAAAIIAYLTGEPASEVTGRGSGIPDETFRRKIEIVENVSNLDKNLTGEEVLMRIGGFELAAMAGFILRAASQNIPIILDGVITAAAALVAVRIREECKLFLIASHNSVEPGAMVALNNLNLQPILDLELRLGEGTGAALAIPILRAGCNALNEMALLSDLN